MLKFFRYLKPYWKQVCALLIAIYVQVWGSLQLPSLMADIVNKGIVSGDQDFIWKTGFTMVLYAVFSAVGSFFASFLSAKVGTAIARDIRNDIFKKILSFSISEIDRYSTASLITRTTNDINQVQQAIVMCLSMLLRAPLTCIGAIVQAISTAPDMTWIIALSVGVLLLSIVLIMGAVMPKFRIFQRLIDRITLLTRENLTGLRVIRAFNNEKLEKSKFSSANTELTNTLLFINRIMSLQNPLMTLIFNGTTLLCIWIGVSLMTTNFEYLGNMMAFMQYAIQVIMSFLFLAILFVILPRANVSAARIDQVLKTRTKIRWRSRTKGSPTSTPSVEFKKVSFSYGGAEAKVLSNISFTARAGETTAFIGSTGSGKSTLINLVPRFYEASSGEVLVSGVNVKQYSEKDLMSKIGYVPQRGVLFAGTVRDNIAFGLPNASDSAVKKALTVSQSAEFVKKMDKGLDSHIAQGGNNVSGGQKQRLSIARAICKQPDIYIFDDSFSALDMKTDAKLRKALRPLTKNTVTLIVAQRVSTIKDAEKIVVLDKGRIVGEGTHYDLLKKCQVYQEIAKSQLSDAEYAAELKLADRKEVKNA